MKKRSYEIFEKHKEKIVSSTNLIYEDFNDLEYIPIVNMEQATSENQVIL